MAKKLILPAIKIEQKLNSKKDIFLLKMKVENLLDETAFETDTWSQNLKNTKEQGYQRKPIHKKIQKVANFVQEEAEPIFPTSVLISSRNVLKYNDGKLTLEPFPLFIVDGQHRIEGLRVAYKERDMQEIGEWEIPVVILSNFSQIEEANQFQILNKTQTGIKPDLNERLLFELVKNDFSLLDSMRYELEKWKVRIVPVIDALNEKEDSVWNGRITLPNEKKTRAQIVNQTSLVSSLKPLFLKGHFQEVYDVDAIYNTINNYWKALKKIFPHAFLKPNDYVIMKTPGIFSLHLLLERILARKGESCRTEQNFMEILKEVFSEKDTGKSDFWRKDNLSGAAQFGSMKGFKYLADRRFAINLPWAK